MIDLKTPITILLITEAVIIALICANWLDHKAGWFEAEILNSILVVNLISTLPLIYTIYQWKKKSKPPKTIGYKFAISFLVAINLGLLYILLSILIIP